MVSATTVRIKSSNGGSADSSSYSGSSSLLRNPAVGVQAHKPSVTTDGSRKCLRATESPSSPSEKPTRQPHKVESVKSPQSVSRKAKMLCPQARSLAYAHWSRGRGGVFPQEPGPATIRTDSPLVLAAEAVESLVMNAAPQVHRSAKTRSQRHESGVKEMKKPTNR